MIVITGAAGFIGSCLTAYLNEKAFYDLVLVDDFTDTDKKKNISGKQYSSLVHRDEFFDWLRVNHRMVQFIFHLGARTDTTEFDYSIFEKLNLSYSKAVWNNCVEYGI